MFRGLWHFSKHPPGTGWVTAKLENAVKYSSTQVDPHTPHTSNLSFIYCTVTIAFTWSSQCYARCYGQIIKPTSPFWGALTVFICGPTRRPYPGGCGGSGRRRKAAGPLRSSARSRACWHHTNCASLRTGRVSGGLRVLLLSAASCRFLRLSLRKQEARITRSRPLAAEVCWWRSVCSVHSAPTSVKLQILCVNKSTLLISDIYCSHDIN